MALKDITLAVTGNTEFATRDSDIKTTLRDVETATLEPYLVRATETGVCKGTLDLDFTLKVESKRLTAPGRLAENEVPASRLRPQPRDYILSTHWPTDVVALRVITAELL